MGDLGSIFLLSLLAMFTPTLLAAVTVMMLLPNPKKLMLGYLLGAYLTSITLGLLIVFSLHGSGSVSTAKHTLGPIEDIVFGALAPRRRLRCCGRAGGPDCGSAGGASKRSRRSREKESLARADARAGARPGSPSRSASSLTLPGVSYLTALDRMAKLDAGAFRDRAAGRRLLPDPAAAAGAAAARLLARAGADPAGR